MLALCQFNARLSSLSITHTSAELFLLFINAAAGVPGGGAGRCNFSCTADTDRVKSPAVVSTSKDVKLFVPCGQESAFCFFIIPFATSHLVQSIELRCPH